MPRLAVAATGALAMVALTSCASKAPTITADQAKAFASINAAVAAQVAGTRPTASLDPSASPGLDLTATPTATPTGPKRVVVGLGDQNVHDLASWFRILCVSPAAGWRCTDRGASVNGGLTGSYADRVTQVLADKPDVVVVEGGSNDVNVGTPAAQTLDHLEATVKALAAAKVAVALVDVVPPSAPNSTRLAATAAINDGLPAIAAKYSASLITLHDLLAGPDGTYKAGYAGKNQPTSDAFKAMATSAAMQLRAAGLYG